MNSPDASPMPAPTTPGPMIFQVCFGGSGMSRTVTAGKYLLGSAKPVSPARGLVGVAIGCVSLPRRPGPRGQQTYDLQHPGDAVSSQRCRRRAVNTAGRNGTALSGARPSGAYWTWVHFLSHGGW